MSDCTLWTGGRSEGYGIISQYPSAPIRVHQFVYATFVGPIPKGYHVHHECHQRLCINPDHLTLLSGSEHSKRHARPRLTCTICGRPQNARGYCATHYLRWKRWGDPLLVSDAHGHLGLRP